MEVETDGFRISSNFDSGNLHRIEKVQPGTVVFDGQGADDLCAHEFNCWVRPDCAGTEYENNNRTWFHFSFAGGPPFATVRFNIMNMNRQGKLYAQGMRTVYRVEPLFPEWKRLSDSHVYKVEDNNFIMSFKYYTLEDSRCTTYFAFSYPFSYTELQTQLNKRDLQFRIAPPVGVYYHRELLTYTLDGRRIDLLTITANTGGEGAELRLPGLFPLAQTHPRAVRFPGRKVILLSARVHPGETPSSHVMNGCIRFLLSTDARAVRLRQLYVFKIIPMLNPDGVARGHYRTNIHGANMNRMYGDPTRALYPEIHAAKSVALYHHLGRLPAECEVLDSEPSVAEVDAQFVRPRELPAPPRPPDGEDASNEASCFCGPDDESSLGPPDLSPLKSLLQMTPRLLRPGERSERLALVERITERTSDRFSERTTERVLEITAERVAEAEVAQEASEAPLPPMAAAALRAELRQTMVSSGAASDTESLVSSGETESASSATVAGSQAAPSDAGAADSGLFLYIDMHGHASKRGCFMYGNHFPCEETMADCMLLPKLISLNSPDFDFLACNFTEKNMLHKGKKDGLSKEGSGRVALYRATGLVQSYTLECSYNTGRFCNVLPPLPGEPEIPGERPLVLEPVAYTPLHYQRVGEAMMISVLDLTGDNPLSRLPRSEYRDTAGVRAWIKRFMQVTKFGENNILFSPEKTARTMKVTDRHRSQAKAAAGGADDRGATCGRTAAASASPSAAQRRLSLVGSPGRPTEGGERRRPVRRVRKAKKVSPGQAEDQENAAVAPANQRSPESLLAAAAGEDAKHDSIATISKESPAEAPGLAGPSQLRVKSPVLQPRSGFGQAGNAQPGLARKPSARRALSEKRKVLKPTPVRVGSAPGGGAPKLRRSASLVTAAEPPRAETSVVASLNLILGDEREVAGLSWPDPAPVAGPGKLAGAPKKTAPAPKPTPAAAPKPKRVAKRKKRATSAKQGESAGRAEALPACRSLGQLIQMASTPPVSFSSLFMSPENAGGELESSARSLGFLRLGGEPAAEPGPSGWPRHEPLDAQDESATLPDELDEPRGRQLSCESSPLSFAGALSSASNSPRPSPPEGGSPRFGRSASHAANPPRGSQEMAKGAQEAAPKLGARSPVHSHDCAKVAAEVPRSAGGGRRPTSPPLPRSDDTPDASTQTSLAEDSAQVLPPRSPRARRPALKTRCSARMTAKKSAKTLRAKRSAPVPAEAAEQGGSAAAPPADAPPEKAAKLPRKKLARRASAPVFHGSRPLMSTEIMTSLPADVTDVSDASETVPRIKPLHLKMRSKTRPKKAAATGRSASSGVCACAPGVSGHVAAAPEPVLARRALSEGHQAAERPAEGPVTSEAGVSRLIKKKTSKVIRRGGLERRPGLQQVKKRKKMKEKV